MENKTLLQKIDEICKENQDNDIFQTVRIEGEKTNILIEKQKKDESKTN